MVLVSVVLVSLQALVVLVHAPVQVLLFEVLVDVLVQVVGWQELGVQPRPESYRCTGTWFCMQQTPAPSQTLVSHSAEPSAPRSVATDRWVLVPLPSGSPQTPRCHPGPS